jgi:exoribonuclease R
LKAIHDPKGALAGGLSAIRRQFQLPDAFPPDVEAAAAQAVTRAIDGHADRREWPFMTLDPASSRDLDQAFHIERSGADLLLHYAIADVGWFVAPGDALDREAWQRGTSIYLPGAKVPLYPPILSEGAASLLPDVDRPAIVFSVRVDPAGRASLDGAERALIRSRAKLGYATVTDSDLPPCFFELARRIEAAEEARGAARIDPPQQIVEACADGGYALGFRPMSSSERHNAAMSLACNLAIAALLIDCRAGLFRNMAEPGKRARKRLRHSARALGLDWPGDIGLDQFERRLDPNIRSHAAFMLAARRAGDGASYAPFGDDRPPWHAAVAAPYVHATAPLRRLADRHVCAAALALANDASVPDWAATSFATLGPIMDRAEQRAAQVDSAVLELAEAVVLAGREGTTYDGCVIETDERGAKLQLCSEPVVTRIAADGLEPGTIVPLRLVEALPSERRVRFEAA